MAVLLPATQPTGDPPGCLAGIGTASLTQPGHAVGLVRHEGPWHRVPAVSPIPVMRAVPGGTGVPDCLCGAELLWPTRCNAVRVPATAGRGNRLPGEV